MSGPIVRAVVDVESVALAHGLSVTDHGITSVHGQWAARGVVLSASEHANGHVTVAVDCRGGVEDETRLWLCRTEGGVPVDQVHQLVGVALRQREQVAA